jgi:glyoxylase-like metal-dependent hydrolase (beta-lactamase superfamily II)
MIFRQLFDPASSTYTYLLGDSGEALLIDPVYEQVPRDLALLQELGLRLRTTLDTHVHADHVTGAWRLRQRCGSLIALAAVVGAEGVNRPLQHGDRIDFGMRHLTVRATPGHTNGCLTYVLDDQSMAFTGDSLLIRGCGRTDFQQGSPRLLFASVRGQILTLPDDCLLYPAHDYRGITVTSVAEEQRFNPRLGGAVDVGDFTGHMNNLNLPHPKLMAVAVPANLRCGQPEDDAPDAALQRRVGNRADGAARVRGNATDRRCARGAGVHRSSGPPARREAGATFAVDEPAGRTGSRAASRGRVPLRSTFGPSQRVTDQGRLREGGQSRWRHAAVEDGGTAGGIGRRLTVCAGQRGLDGKDRALKLPAWHDRGRTAALHRTCACADLVGPYLCARRVARDRPLKRDGRSTVACRISTDTDCAKRLMGRNADGFAAKTDFRTSQQERY